MNLDIPFWGAIAGILAFFVAVLAFIRDIFGIQVKPETPKNFFKRLILNRWFLIITAVVLLSFSFWSLYDEIHDLNTILAKREAEITAAYATQTVQLTEFYKRPTNTPETREITVTVVSEREVTVVIEREITVPVPSSSPQPTYTPYPPLSTYTPMPTYTPYPPLPTYTSMPTYTPLPTYTPATVSSPQLTTYTDELTSDSNQQIEIVEIEPNNSSAVAQMISSIGAPNWFEASITDEDQDWYRFEAVAGRTYVVEVFNVADSLGLTSASYECGFAIGDHQGVGLNVYNSSEDRIKQECSPNGVGNVHVATRFTATSNGIYYIQVYPHNKSSFGSYSMRILPKYDESDAWWNPATFEPNNNLVNAYQILPGNENALLSQIEQEQSTATHADRDWYRFEAVAGRTYVVEVFNVADSLGLTSASYECGFAIGNHQGLHLMVYNPSEDRVKQECSPNGSGEVHVYTQFEANSNGIYYIQLSPHSSTGYGTYSIRVLSN